MLKKGSCRAGKWVISGDFPSKHWTGFWRKRDKMEFFEGFFTGVVVMILFYSIFILPHLVTEDDEVELERALKRLRKKKEWEQKEGEKGG